MTDIVLNLQKLGGISLYFISERTAMTLNSGLCEWLISGRQLPQLSLYSSRFVSFPRSVLSHSLGPESHNAIAQDVLRH